MSRVGNIQQAGFEVVRRLREHGHAALFAGGCVRDMLMGRQPVDIDVATDAPPERVCELFSRHAEGRGGVRGCARPAGPLLGRGRDVPHGSELQGRPPARGRGLQHAAGRRPAPRFHDQRALLRPDQAARDRLRRGRGGSARASSARSASRSGASAKTTSACSARSASRRALALPSSRRPRPPSGTTPGSCRASAPTRVREELSKMFAHPARAAPSSSIASLGLLAHLWPGAERDLSSEQETARPRDLETQREGSVDENEIRKAETEAPARVSAQRLGESRILPARFAPACTARRGRLRSSDGRPPSGR